ERIPFAGVFADVAGGGGDGIEAAGVLVGLDLTVTAGFVVEHLDFDARAVAVVIAVLRHADIDAAVAARLELVFQSQIEIIELLLASQPGAFFTRTDDRAVFDLPTFFSRQPSALPAGARLAIEKRSVAGRI